VIGMAAVVPTATSDVEPFRLAAPAARSRKRQSKTYICAGCGYGICVSPTEGLPRCPMCRVQSWRPDRARLLGHLC
jgi:rubrerythrin